MTQVRGIYCSYCRIRYAYHACKPGMPCKHQFAEPVRDGVKAPATLIGCGSWRYSEGFKRFDLQKLHFLLQGDQFVKKWVPEEHFQASYVTEEELIELFLKFLKKIQLFEWSAWTEAFVSLIFGGTSQTFPPAWRWRQLTRKRQEQMELVCKRTRIISFERPLDPQPPYSSTPYWHGLGELAFYQGAKKVWDQKIPEASWDFKDSIRGLKVVRKKRWGWILRFQMTHEVAGKVWSLLFNDFLRTKRSESKNGEVE